jgi:hypothetical protein
MATCNTSLSLRSFLTLPHTSPHFLTMVAVSDCFCALGHNCRYNEVSAYTNYASPNMADFSKWGHFTQVVWKSSTHIGCAAQVCNTGLLGSGGTIVVCK